MEFCSISLRHPLRVVEYIYYEERANVFVLACDNIFNKIVLDLFHFYLCVCVCLSVCLFVCLCLCLSVCTHVYMNTDVHRSQKRVSEPMELELQTALSSPVWVLGTEFCSSARAASVT